MDLAHLRLVQATNPYGFEAEVPSSLYGTPIEIQQLPRSLSSDFCLQLSSLNQAPTTSLSAEQQPWPQRVLDEVRDLLIILSADGRVNYASPSCKSITGFDPAQLEHDNFSRFIHDDDKVVFARELNECIATARPLRCHFRMYQIDNSSCLIEAHGHPHLTTLNNDGSQNQFCHGVFLVCRPYHTHSTQLLDSFLEHKLENIRLKERIALLKKEEENDVNTTSQQTKLLQIPSSASHRPIPLTSKVFAATQSATSNFSSSQEPSVVGGEDNESSDALGNIDDLDQALSRAVAAAQNEEDISPINEIELRTGLFYGEGERSQGISTGIPQGHLYHYTGLQPPSEQLAPPENEPRKRLRGEYRCADCGTSDSPEWRKGPDGPKSLCNACGLRWSKKEKKRQDSGS
ncbi:hypothetical protein BDW59DRAFT_117537 [Aspergillus cavernicola]|uniref:GATA transcription factor LreB n=1 Tax=Aspergillus cavernicola TaxID=176166 RepID=A0ABR4HXH8_9EURO